MTDRLPTEEGVYFWSEWNRNVRVYLRGKSLFVRVYSHWPPVKITSRITGTFTKTDAEVYTTVKEPA